MLRMSQIVGSVDPGIFKYFVKLERTGFGNPFKMRYAVLLYMYTIQ